MSCGVSQVGTLIGSNPSCPYLISVLELNKNLNKNLNPCTKHTYCDQKYKIANSVLTLLYDNFLHVIL